MADRDDRSAYQGRVAFGSRVPRSASPAVWSSCDCPAHRPMSVIPAVGCIRIPGLFSRTRLGHRRCRRLVESRRTDKAERADSGARSPPLTVPSHRHGAEPTYLSHVAPPSHARNAARMTSLASTRSSVTGTPPDVDAGRGSVMGLLLHPANVVRNLREGSRHRPDSAAHPSCSPRRGRLPAGRAGRGHRQPDPLGLDERVGFTIGWEGPVPLDRCTPATGLRGPLTVSRTAPG
jgi:hypothetical protein